MAASQELVPKAGNPSRSWGKYHSWQPRSGFHGSSPSGYSPGHQNAHPNFWKKKEAKIRQQEVTASFRTTPHPDFFLSPLVFKIFFFNLCFHPSSHRNSQICIFWPKGLNLMTASMPELLPLTLLRRGQRKKSLNFLYAGVSQNHQGNTR